MKDEKEIPATKVMEEQRKHEASCEEGRKTIDRKFYGIYGEIGNDKRFDKVGNKIEKGGGSTDFWSIAGLCALILMMFSGGADDNDFNDFSEFDDF